MWEQEKDHLKKFEELIPKYRVRPSALLPIWNIAGFALGLLFYQIFLSIKILIKNSFSK